MRHLKDPPNLKLFLRGMPIFALLQQELGNTCEEDFFFQVHLGLDTADSFVVHGFIKPNISSAVHLVPTLLDPTRPKHGPHGG